jgi:hypothetical protein
VLAGLAPSNQTVGSRTTAQFSIMIHSKKNTQYKDTELFFSLMLNAYILNVAMLSVVMQNAIITCVVILNLIMMTDTCVEFRYA